MSFEWRDVCRVRTWNRKDDAADVRGSSTPLQSEHGYMLFLLHDIQGGPLISDAVQVENNKIS